MAAPVGAIAERVHGLIPVTWDAMLVDNRGFGDGLLQGAIDVAKENLTGQVITPANEASTYPLIVIDYIAKVAVLEIIPGAIDFWMDNPIGVTITGTDEAKSYESRVNALESLQERLLEETRAKFDEIAALIGFRRVSPRRPLMDTIADPLLTPSPLEFPRPYRVTTGR
jgi:hypothetical protein